MNNQQLFKGSLATIILKLLNEHDKMYGYEIVNRVKEITNDELKITEGALYPCLKRMKEENLIEVEFMSIGNRVRKYYKLTEVGTRETLKKLEELDSYIRIMRLLVNPKFRNLD